MSGKIDRERYESFVEVMLDYSSVKKLLSVSEILELLEPYNSKEYKLIGKPFLDPKTVRSYVDEMKKDGYPVKEDFKIKNGKNIIAYGCDAIKSEIRELTEDDFFKKIQIYIRSGYLTMKDVEDLIADDFYSLNQNAQKRLYQYFGFKDKLSFKMDKFITKVKAKFGIEETSKFIMPEYNRNIVDLIEKANRYDEQIVFHYKNMYNFQQNNYEYSINDTGNKRLFRYCVYDTFRIGKHYYTIGHDIIEPYTERCYRLDRIPENEIWLRKDKEPKRYGENRYPRHNKEYVPNKWSALTRMIEFKAGLTKTIRIEIDDRNLNFMLEFIKEKVKYIKRVNKTGILIFEGKINTEFFTLLNMFGENNNRIKIYRVFIDGKWYDNTFENREKLKEERNLNLSNLDV